MLINQIKSRAVEEAKGTVIWERLKVQTFQVWFKIFMIHSGHSAKGGEAAVHTAKSKVDGKIQ